MPRPCWDPLAPISAPSIRRRAEHKATGSNYSRQYHLPGDTMATQPCCQILFLLPARPAPLPAPTAALLAPLPCPPRCSPGPGHGVPSQRTDMGTTYGTNPSPQLVGYRAVPRLRGCSAKFWAGITMCSTQSTPSWATAGRLATSLHSSQPGQLGKAPVPGRAPHCPALGCNRASGAGA